MPWNMAAARTVGPLGIFSVDTGTGPTAGVPFPADTRYHRPCPGWLSGPARVRDLIGIDIRPVHGSQQSLVDARPGDGLAHRGQRGPVGSRVALRPGTRELHLLHRDLGGRAGTRRVAVERVERVPAVRP